MSLQMLQVVGKARVGICGILGLVILISSGAELERVALIGSSIRWLGYSWRLLKLDEQFLRAN